MKIFDSKNNTNKSWALKLSTYPVEEKTVVISAVDSNTGNHITYLIMFELEGTIVIPAFAEDALQEKGYDPHEHGNKFDSAGRIIIEKIKV